jgi:protein O-GlcNAc transferase
MVTKNQDNNLIQKAIRNFELGQLSKAEKLLNQILNGNPSNFDALYLKGVIHGIQSKYESCKNYLLSCEKINPSHINLQYNLAKVMIELGFQEKALIHYEKVVKLIPNDYEAWLSYGKCFFNQMMFIDSLKCFDKSIELKPDDADSYYSRGLVYSDLKLYKKAAENYEKAILIKPDFAEAYYNLGIVFTELQLYDQALINYEKAIDYKNNYAEAYNNRGFVLFITNHMFDALASYDKAIQYMPDYAEAHYNRGVVLQELQYYELALSSYDMAVNYRNNYAEAYNNRGFILKKLGHYDLALKSYESAILYLPDYADAHYNRGLVLQKLRRFKEALSSYDKAIEYKGDFVEAFNNRGNVLKELELFDLALISYEKANEINSEFEYLYGILLHTKMLICDWQNLDKNISKLVIKINEGKKCSPNLPVLALIDSLELQFKNAEIWINDKHPFNSSLGAIRKYQRKQKIKLAYFSENFNEHAVSYLIVELLELHNKNKFELIGFNYSPEDSSQIYTRVSSSFDHFINIQHKSDKEVAKISRDIEIDIAIDLTGLTGNARTGIFAYRAAPIQLSYLGYLGTIGAKYYDYIIADLITIPIENQKYYSEKIIYLPSYQVNDTKRVISDKILSRAQLNIPDNIFVFCCFNNTYKITPITFDGWMRILRAVPESCLLLLADNQWAEANLRIEAEKRGICQERLVFCGRINRSEYLARFKIADLFLDTSPYNAGTTASDALWAGLPVLTCAGESFASRIAASILNSIELNELITTTQQQYEDRAIELSCDPVKLKVIRDKLVKNRMSTSLFDTIKFTKIIETAYAEIYERYHSELAPDHIYLKD